MGQHQRGPKTLEAFRADAIDVGSAPGHPAAVRAVDRHRRQIVATTSRVDALNHPVYELGVAPGVDVTSLEDLKGKTIAYSPGQAQGALVLRALDEAGLTQDDVELVEIQSVDDVYVNALGRNRSTSPRSVARSSRRTSPSTPTTAAPRSRPGSATTRACSTRRWDHRRTPTRRPRWPSTSWSGPRPSSGSTSTPRSTPQAFYVDHEGLTIEDGLALVQAAGQLQVPLDWDETIAAHQATADLLAEEQDHDELDVAGLYDRRYEKVMADGLGGGSYYHGSRAPDHGRRRTGRRQARRTAPARARDAASRSRWLIGPILLVGLWWLLSATGRLDPRTLSEPWVVVETARDLIETGRLQEALKTSAVRAFAGLGLGHRWSARSWPCCPA